MSETLRAAADRNPTRALPFLEQRSFAAVLWDWDGVLVDLGYNFYHAYEMVLRDEGIVTNPREIYLREGERTPRLLKATSDRHNVPIDDARIKELVVRRREYDAGLAERELFPSVPPSYYTGYDRLLPNGDGNWSIKEVDGSYADTGTGPMV